MLKTCPKLIKTLKNQQCDGRTHRRTYRQTDRQTDRPTNRVTYRVACTRLKRLVDYLFDFYFLFCRISHSDVENLLHSTDKKRQKCGMAFSRILMLLLEKITGRVLILMFRKKNLLTSDQNIIAFPESIFKNYMRSGKDISMPLI